MAEQFIYSSVLAPHMRHLLDIKASAGLSVLRTKWILKEIDDFANAEHLEDSHITESFFKRWRATRNGNLRKQSGLLGLWSGIR